MSHWPTTANVTVSSRKYRSSGVHSSLPSVSEHRAYSVSMSSCFTISTLRPGLTSAPSDACGGDGSEGQGHAARQDTGARAPEQERRTAEMCSCTDSGIVVLDFFPGFTTIPAPATGSSR